MWSWKLWPVTFPFQIFTLLYIYFLPVVLFHCLHKNVLSPLFFVSVIRFFLLSYSHLFIQIWSLSNLSFSYFYFILYFSLDFYSKAEHLAPLFILLLFHIPLFVSPPVPIPLLLCVHVCMQFCRYKDVWHKSQNIIRRRHDGVTKSVIKI